MINLNLTALFSLLGCDAYSNFLCSSGECIQRRQICDGMMSCKDGSDEYQCPGQWIHSRLPL